MLMVCGMTAVWPNEVCLYPYKSPARPTFTVMFKTASKPFRAILWLMMMYTHTRLMMMYTHTTYDCKLFNTLAYDDAHAYNI